jgi:Fe2+ transport system protein FeoA
MTAETASAPVPLASLDVGATAVLHGAALDEAAMRLLRALGLSADRPLRLCKAGEPCIVQVGATRIGVSREVAAQILVRPVAASAR